ncbi:unnamed protein product [Tilletia controversa]|uniref:Uncharacterized protein n=1 Tax=Tilletia controversa TaxID=13291 RepID=A0A8X7MJU7_9BASI|nr:hypothetical protein CF328_g7756 [Tilletia controversa]KAE8238886.1 hypothetical protein A4X06_0g8591 [Tilletia controversa]CAD6972959.1 unnamed protein product [Tilletia controversa]
MSPVDQTSSADISPTTTVVALPLTDAEEAAAVDPDLANSLGIPSDAEVTILRPAFWRRKSEEEFLRATVVCVSKNASPACASSSGSRNGSFSSESMSPKPSCLKRSPSAPHRPAHVLGLTALRSKSVTASTCGGRNHRAVRFDSKPPAAAFTHSGKDYDRTPIESTQGKGGDLDVSLPPRGGSISPELDNDDDDGEDAADVEEEEEETDAALSTTPRAATATATDRPLALFPVSRSPELEQAISPGLTSYSEATSGSSAASSVFYDSDSSSAASSTASYSALGQEKNETSSSSSFYTSINVPCSSEVERAMLRRKLEFGARWMRNFVVGGSTTSSSASSSYYSSFEGDDLIIPAPPSAVVTAVETVSSSAAHDDDDEQVVVMALAAVDLENDGDGDNPSSSDLSSTLCGSGSSVEGRPSSFPFHQPSSSSEESSADEDGSGSGSGRCAFTTKVLSKTFLPMSTACRRYDGSDEDGDVDGDGATPPIRAVGGEEEHSIHASFSEFGFPRCSADDIDLGGSSSSSSMMTAPQEQQQTSPGSSPEKDRSLYISRNSSASGSDGGTGTQKKKKKVRCLSGSAESQSQSRSRRGSESAFACRRDFLLENGMGGGALDGF